MCSTDSRGALVLVEQLHSTVDTLLGHDLTDEPDSSLPELVQRLVALGHRVHAAQLDAIGAFDRAEMAALGPHRTTRRWLEHRARLAPGTAAGLVRQARAVRDHLADTRAALAAADIGAPHVAATTSVVARVGVEHAEAAEPILVDLARRSEPGVVRRAASHLHAVVDPDGAERRLHRVWERRGLTLSTAGDRVYLDGVLDVESAETVQAALAPLMAPDPAEQADRRSAPQRRADALVDLARRALDAGELPMLGGERPHLSLVVEATALTGGGGGASLPWTGETVPASTARRWACDAQLTPVVVAAPGGPSRAGDGWLPMAVGRASRTVTTGQLKALRVRDGGCVHPGCARTAAFCDAHHVVHWVDGGRTDLDNMVLLCRHHHRTLHAGRWSLHADATRPQRFWADGVNGSRREAQTAADRSPPLRPPPRVPTEGRAPLPQRSPA